ncbi:MULTISPECIES: tail fiber/spike domain-containing protein [Yersinia]|uniref:tail fiber/spike domain-containing protein n=1 Tax=Yersinia TaxID=629 RepID=UPI0009B716A0|nr:MULTISPECIES: hypothetical protein [Yersinia]ARB85975.1 hypothetical protein A6J67_19770 [Yersinia sp. FDAARGOS_228]AVL35822.1 hypothetical protein CEQ36_09450 [Yersinia intermedia]
MTTTPTQNPVPSEAAVDLKFNAGKIDEFVTSFLLKYTDRLGREHLTIEGMRDIIEKAIKAFGFVTMDSFEDGATLDNSSQVLRWESNGEYYRWDGSFPKVVPAASTPETSGGIGIGAWLSVGDAALRGNLSSNADGEGDALVGSSINGRVGTVHSELQLLWGRGFIQAEDYGDLTSINATELLQSALDDASSAQVPVVIKTPNITVGGLKIGSNTTIIMPNVTLKLKDNSNVPLFSNKNIVFAGSTPIDKNITIFGGTFDFNGINQADTTSTGEWQIGMTFVGVNGLNFQGVTTFRNSRRFNALVCNCINVDIEKSIIENDVDIPSTNKDGWHVNGYTLGFKAGSIIANNSDDDALALNADDGNFGGVFTPAHVTGPIQDVCVDQIILKGSTRNGVRLLSANVSIRNVNINSISGDVSAYALVADDYGLGSGSHYENINIGSINCNFKTRPYSGATFGMVHISTTNNNSSLFSDITIGKVFRKQEDVDGQNRPTITFVGSRTLLNIGLISENNCSNSTTVYMPNPKGGVELNVDKFKRINSRPESGAYGNLIRVEGSGVILVDKIRIGSVVSDSLNSYVQVVNSKISKLEINKTSTTIAKPIGLTNGDVGALFFQSNTSVPYLLYDERYSKSGTSSVGFERPAPQSGTTAQRPINALYGDSYFDTTIGAQIVWHGIWTAV